MPWSARFEDPVPGCETLRDAATRITKLPKAEQAKPHWQIAAWHLIHAADEKVPLMVARIAMLRAINHGKPAPEKEPRRKRVKVWRVVG